MRYYDVFDSDEFDEDRDDQDGTYFKDYEPPYQEEYLYDDTFIESYEAKDLNALLYIRAHYNELIIDEAYKKAYFRLINEMVRKIAYFSDNKSKFTISHDDYKKQEAALDFLIRLEGKKKIEKYKDDAAYIVNLINSGNV